MLLASIRQAPYTVDRFPDDGKHYVTLFVDALGVEGEPAVLEPAKCLGWRWCDWSAMPQPLFAPLASLFATGFVPASLSASAP